MSTINFNNAQKQNDVTIHCIVMMKTYLIEI